MSTIAISCMYCGQGAYTTDLEMKHHLHSCSRAQKVKKKSYTWPIWKRITKSEENQSLLTNALI